MNAFLKQKAREFWQGLSIEERRALAAPLLVFSGVAPAASVAAAAPAQAVQPARSRANANSRIMPVAVVAADSVVAVRAAGSRARPAPSVPAAVASTASVAAAAATCSDAGTSLARNRRPPPALAGRPSTRRQVLQEVRPMMLVRTCSQSRLSVSKFVNVIVTRLLQHIPLQAHHAQVQPAGGLDQSQLRHAVARHLS